MEARWRYLAAALIAVLAVAAACTQTGHSIHPRAAGVQAGAAVTDPLDPLTSSEIVRTVAILQTTKRFAKGALFPIVTLQEPPKSEVYAWRRGQPFSRRAYAQVFLPTPNKLFDAVVDLRTGTIARWRPRPGKEPAVPYAVYSGSADGIVRRDPRWQAAMRRRGLDPKDVYLDVWAPGDLNLPRKHGYLLRALSFYRGKLPNPYDRPIEGVLVTLDMSRRKVISVIDTGVRPVDTTTSGAAGTKRPGLKPLIVSQPRGPSFHMHGREVVWQRWHFTVGFSMREGLVLYRIGYEDRGVVRPIIYRMSMDEIYVPYAIPDKTWTWRAALDVGEYNLGQLAQSLRPGVDVPQNAVFFNEAVPTSVGRGVYVYPHTIAMYEQDDGSLWTRTDPSSGARQGHMARELVVTAMYANGNYTYSVSYVFRMDGGIDIRVGATGTTLNRGVKGVGQGASFGTPVTPTIAAPAHQHFFNFRIDFDVDGQRNRLLEENTRTVPSAIGNEFVTRRRVIRREGFRDANPLTNRRWMVESAARTNALHEPTAYELDPIDYSRPYSGPGFPPLRHAAFAAHALWVTRYRPNELYATGPFPNLGPAGGGLPRYVVHRQSVDARDLVVWYTVGFTHNPTVEEYPVMTGESVGFAIRPAGFFDRNPALDAP